LWRSLEENAIWNLKIKLSDEGDGESTDKG